MVMKSVTVHNLYCSASCGRLRYSRCDNIQESAFQLVAACTSNFGVKIESCSDWSLVIGAVWKFAHSQIRNDRIINSTWHTSQAACTSSSELYININIIQKVIDEKYVSWNASPIFFESQSDSTNRNAMTKRL
jgi:hypothetical protein